MQIFNRLGQTLNTYIEIFWNTSRQIWNTSTDIWNL
jgi:hypothetical protein